MWAEFGAAAPMLGAVARPGIVVACPRYQIYQTLTGASAPRLVIRCYRFATTPSEQRGLCRCCNADDTAVVVGSADRETGDPAPEGPFTLEQLETRGPDDSHWCHHTPKPEVLVLVDGETCGLHT